MRRIVLAVAVGLALSLVIGMIVVAANPDDYELVRYLYTFETEDQVTPWIATDNAIESVFNVDPQFVRQGAGSIGYHVKYPTNSKNYADLRIYFQDEFADWGGAQYLGFWMYVSDVNLLGNSYKKWSTRVLIEDAGGSPVDVHFPVLSNGWNFLIMDLTASSGIKMVDLAPLLEEGQPIPVFYVVGKGPGDVGLMTECISMFVVRQMLSVEVTSDFWIYIDGIALYK